MRETIQALRESAEQLEELNSAYERALSMAPKNQDEERRLGREIIAIKEKIIRQTFTIKKTIKQAERQSVQNA